VVALVGVAGRSSSGEIKVFGSNGPGWLWVVTDFLRGRAATRGLFLA
jgi:hypothetical protein